MPRITALHILRSTIETVSAPASSSFRGSLPHPTQPLCTLRVRRHRRLTQHSLPGGPLSITWAGLAPADRASFAWRLLSFDHLVGAGEKIRGDRDAEGARRPQIDDEVELGGLVNRKITGLGPAQDAIDVARRTPERVNRIGPVGDQAATGDVV